MNDAMKLWTRLFLRLGLVLLAVGLIPLALTSTILTTWDQLVPIMLSFTVAPLGALALLVAVILFLAGLVRRRRESS